MKKITIFGKASQKYYPLPPINNNEEDLTLLEYIRKFKFPMASSCGGKGQCRTCVVNKDLLSCMTTIKDLLIKNAEIDEVVITINYL